MINYLILLSKVRGLVFQTFKPKPRKMPRRLISTSQSFDCTSLRAANKARTSCPGSDLQCTRLNNRVRINCAIAARILAIGFDRNRFEGVAHGPRFQQLDRRTRVLHAVIEPLGQRPGL